jgi:Abortive infection C-terminus
MSRFSPFVIKALVDTITGGSANDPTPSIGIYRSGPRIEQFIFDCGLDLSIGSNSRVPATTDFLRRLARSADGETLTRLLLRVADPRKDIEGLIRAVQEPLNLSPGRMDLPAEIEADIRQVLGGLTSAAKGIGALRTHGGDAHGREKGYRRIDSRIARFAINAASSIALFLIETSERQQRRALPLRKDAA